MAHFARIENNIVTQVVVVDNKDTSDAQGVEKEHIGAAHLEKCYRDWETDRKSTRLNSSHSRASRMPSSA